MSVKQMATPMPPKQLKVLQAARAAATQHWIRTHLHRKPDCIDHFLYGLRNEKR